MIRLTLVVITLVVISLMFMGVSYGNVWYGENFNDFKDGSLAGQQGWEILPIKANMQSSTIQADVAFGDTGKSVLTEVGQYVIRNFPGAHADTQHVSFHFRNDSDTNLMVAHYIGGGDIKWKAAAHFSIRGLNKKLSAFDGGKHRNIALIELEKWLHFHVVLDFNSQTYDFYMNGKRVVNNWAFKGADNPSLDWFFFGNSRNPDAGQSLVFYIDNISIGAGKGDPTSPPEMAVSSSGKLATTWAELKR